MHKIGHIVLGYTWRTESWKNNPTLPKIKMGDCEDDSWPFLPYLPILWRLCFSLSLFLPLLFRPLSLPLSPPVSLSLSLYFSFSLCPIRNCLVPGRLMSRERGVAPKLVWQESIPGIHNIAKLAWKFLKFICSGIFVPTFFYLIEKCGQDGPREHNNNLIQNIHPELGPY